MTQIELSRKSRYAGVLLLLLLCLFLFGVAGYMLLEKVAFLEATYLTIGTLTTVAPFVTSPARGSCSLSSSSCSDSVLWRQQRHLSAICFWMAAGLHTTGGGRCKKN